MKENELETWRIVAIDVEKEKLIVNRYIHGLEKELTKIWKGWDVQVGNFGYIQILNQMGLETSELEMDNIEINEFINELLNVEDNFDPGIIASALIKVGKKVQFSSNFFEDIKPNKKNN